MTRLPDSITEVFDSFDCAVLDQWGVLHNGTSLYPGVVPCLERIQQAGKSIVVLSNSGRRAAPNFARIESMGIRSGLIGHVVTSGELLWNEIHDGNFAGFGPAPLRAYFITRTPDDTTEWLAGLGNIVPVGQVDDAEVLLFLGTPDGVGESHFDGLLKTALARQIPLVCANPDKSSPRSSGAVVSPGFFADRYAMMEGQVRNYGKPWPAVFDAVRRTHAELAADRFLMIGDSLEHDIAGASLAGMKTLFVRGGLYSESFAGLDSSQDIHSRIAELGGTFTPAVVPDFSLHHLS